jgi:hypothetical protein
MTRKFLKQVTVTGADNSINYYKLFDIAEKYPFVEFGILLSKNSEGYPRFPTWNWIEGLITEKPKNVHLSGHLCGSWLRDIVAGGSAFMDIHQELSYEFGRFQLNFHDQPDNQLEPRKFVSSLFKLTAIHKQQIIFQIDHTNMRLYNYATSQYAKEWGINAVALHDVSGGAGILPDKWPQPMGDYCGYAGGLSPKNVAEQLEIIGNRITNKDGSIYPIWIDAETKLRPPDNSTFDIVLVEQFLRAASPYVLADQIEGKTKDIDNHENIL